MNLSLMKDNSSVQMKHFSLINHLILVQTANSLLYKSGLKRFKKFKEINRKLIIRLDNWSASFHKDLFKVKRTIKRD